MCRMDYAYFTDKGDREHNEDYIGFSEAGDKKIFVLADGLGGHGKGEVASCLVVENVKSMLNDNNVKDEKFLDNCFVMSQKRLLDEQKKSNSNGKMKTTLVILYIDGTTAKYGHIGDSRLYVVKNGKIQKRTIDHSVPQMLALAGEIREKDIRHHEDRNRLLRAMGNEWDDSSPKYEIDDTLLLNILTLGIYGIVIYCFIGKEVNKICEADGKNQMLYIFAWLLGLVTLGIFPLIWIKTCMDRLEDNAYRYPGVNVKHSGTEYVLWALFGSFLAGAGYIVATVYFLQSINAYADVYGLVTPLEYSSNPVERLEIMKQGTITPLHNNNFTGYAPASSDDISTVSYLPSVGKIVWTNGTYRGAEADLKDGLPLTIGRDPKRCNFVLADSLVKISGVHVTVCYIAATDSFNVTDNSKNGTFLADGTRLPFAQTVSYPRGTEFRLADGENAFRLE